MRDEEQIAAFMTELGLPQVGSIVANPSVLKGYFVPLRIKNERDGRKNPSGRTLAKAKDGLSKLGFFG